MRSPRTRPRPRRSRCSARRDLATLGLIGVHRPRRDPQRRRGGAVLVQRDRALGAELRLLAERGRQHGRVAALRPVLDLSGGTSGQSFQQPDAVTRPAPRSLPEGELERVPGRATTSTAARSGSAIPARPRPWSTTRRRRPACSPGARRRGSSHERDGPRPSASAPAPPPRRPAPACGRRCIVIFATVFITYYAFNEGSRSSASSRCTRSSTTASTCAPIRRCGSPASTSARQGRRAGGSRDEDRVHASTTDGLPDPPRRDDLRIRDRLFLEGGYYLELDPGSPSRPDRHDGDEIPAVADRTPVQFYNVLSTFDVATRAQPPEPAGHDEPGVQRGARDSRSRTAAPAG